jgi:hypothetical protein
MYLYLKMQVLLSSLVRNRANGVAAVVRPKEIVKQLKKYAELLDNVSGP